jgi:excisionase family DNA binding protein
MDEAAPSFTVPDTVLDAVAQRVRDVLMRDLADQNGRSPYLTLAEAADYLRYPKGQIYKLTAARAIPHMKHGNRILFHRAQLDAWASDFTVTPTRR